MNRTRAKKSFTLTAEAMTVLVEFQTQTNAASLSAALEKLLQAHQDRQKLDALESRMVRYYDGLTGEAAAEEQDWGAFASSQFVATRESEGRTEVS